MLSGDKGCALSPHPFLRLRHGAYASRRRGILTKTNGLETLLAAMVCKDFPLLQQPRKLRSSSGIQEYF